MAGVNIIPLVEGGSKTAMPSKTGVVLSCGKPVIFCFGVGTKFAELLERYHAVTSVSATDEGELKSAIERATVQEGTLELFKDCFTRKNNVKKYVDSIMEKYG